MWADQIRGATPVPDLRNLDVYLDVGLRLDIENSEMLSDEAYVTLYREKLTEWHDAFPIGPDDDAGAIFARAAALAVELLDDVLAAPSFEPQAEVGLTYAEKIGPADRELDLGADPQGLVNRVRALSPHIGARAELHGRRLTIWRARVEDGRFVPVEVQPEGKRRMGYDELLRGLR